MYNVLCYEDLEHPDAPILTCGCQAPPVQRPGQAVHSLPVTLHPPKGFSKSALLHGGWNTDGQAQSGLETITWGMCHRKASFQCQRDIQVFLSVLILCNHKGGICLEGIQVQRVQGGLVRCCRTEVANHIKRILVNSQVPGWRSCLGFAACLESCISFFRDTPCFFVLCLRLCVVQCAALFPCHAVKRVCSKKQTRRKTWLVTLHFLLPFFWPVVQQLVPFVAWQASSLSNRQARS